MRSLYYQSYSKQIVQKLVRWLWISWLGVFAISGWFYNPMPKLVAAQKPTFQETYTIETQVAFDWEVFVINNKSYLAVANVYDDLSYNLDSKIYTVVFPPALINITPPANTHTVPLSQSISITYNQPISPSTVSSQTFAVYGEQTGLISGTYTVNAGEIKLSPAQSFKPGEFVQVSATTATLSLSGTNPLSPTIWQFRTMVTSGSGIFSNTNQVLSNSFSAGVALGDVDGDSDLDAFVGNTNGADTIWLNNGTGFFTNSGQTLSFSNTQAVALGDIDRDGDLDAIAVAGSNQPDTIWLNNGAGLFSDSGQILGTSFSIDVALGDLDGDNDLDIFVANTSSENNTVWLNNGAGVFTPTSQLFDTFSSEAVALGDIDSDGDLDALVGNTDGPNKVWLNNGAAFFSDSGQSLGTSPSYDFDLGDVDNDGDLDAVLANYNQGNTIWLNTGGGVFTNTGQTLSISATYAIDLGDVDNDGDLDAITSNYLAQANQVWLNQGGHQGSTPGIFSHTNQNLGVDWSLDTALGDLDGDGSLDIFTANWGGNTVWLNTQVNISPAALDDTATVDQNTTNNPLDVLANDYDPDGDTLSITAVGNPSNGSVTNNGSNLAYTPNTDFVGNDSFTYTINDGNGGSDTATVTVTVNPVITNTPPTALDDTATVDQNTTNNTLNVLANDSDPDDDTLTITTTGNPGNGSVSHNGITINYTPNPNFTGTDAFTYTINDGNGGTDTALVTITVTATPIYNVSLEPDQQQSGSPGSTVTYTLTLNNGGNTNDTVALTTSGHNWSVTLLASITNTGSLPFNVIGPLAPGESIAFKVVVNISSTATHNQNDTAIITAQSQGNPAISDTATLTTTAIILNTPPVAVNDLAFTPQGTPVIIDVLANDTDPDGDTLVITAVGTPNNGTASYNPVNLKDIPDNRDFDNIPTMSHINPVRGDGVKLSGDMVKVT